MRRSDYYRINRQGFNVDFHSHHTVLCRNEKTLFSLDVSQVIELARLRDTFVTSAQ